MYKMYVKHDDYVTPKEVWKLLINFVNSNQIIYEPFYCDGKSKEYLNDLGFKNVIHPKDEDFFSNYNKYNYDIIISNPPYSIKSKIFKKLKKRNFNFDLIKV